MKWIHVNENYLDYLRNVEKRIPKTDYGTDKYKPFFGVLFEKDGLYYSKFLIFCQIRLLF